MTPSTPPTHTTHPQTDTHADAMAATTTSRFEMHAFTGTGKGWPAGLFTLVVDGVWDKRPMCLDFALREYPGHKEELERMHRQLTTTADYSPWDYSLYQYPGCEAHQVGCTTTAPGQSKQNATTTAPEQSKPRTWAELRGDW